MLAAEQALWFGMRSSGLRIGDAAVFFIKM